MVCLHECSECGLWFRESKDRSASVCGLVFLGCNRQAGRTKVVLVDRPFASKGARRKPKMVFDVDEA